ncbi:Cochaperone prefoldin complex subunit [Lecanora helva]
MAQSQISVKKQQELQQQYTNYKNSLQQLAQRIGDIEQDTEEHKYVINSGLYLLTRCLENSNVVSVYPQSPANGTIRLVLETLDPLPPDRKCFRMINGVLVERTVEDVKPALQTNSEGLKNVLEELVKQYKRQQDEMEKWKKKNNIQVVQQ